MERIFELSIYPYCLSHLFGQPTLNARQTRWLEFMSEYEVEIKHIKCNQVANALNKIDHKMHYSLN